MELFFWKTFMEVQPKSFLTCCFLISPRTDWKCEKMKGLTYIHNGHVLKTVVERRKAGTREEWTFLVTQLHVR